MFAELALRIIIDKNYGLTVFALNTLFLNIQKFK